MHDLTELYDASQAVLATFDLDEVLGRILTAVERCFRPRTASVRLLDPQRQELQLRAAVGAQRASICQRIALGSGLTGAAARDRRVIHSADVASDARYLSSIAGTRSELAVPLLVRDELVGVLDLQSDIPGFFTADTIKLVTLFAAQASIAIQNARLYRREQRRAEHLEAINAIAREATSVLDLADLLNCLCHVVLQTFPVDHVVVVLCEEGRLVVRRHRGSLTPRIAEGDLLPPGTGLCARALASGDLVVENRVDAIAGYVSGFAETASEMCLPLIARGQPIGVLALESRRSGAFRSHDVEALHPLADICATAIHNAQQYDRVRALACVDGLTGVQNRRRFEECLCAEIDRERRYGGVFSLILADIDHFKRLNDESGHTVGDDVLCQTARLLVEHCRKVDVVCRYGGEEFALVLPQTTTASATQAAEKLRCAIAGFTFPGISRRLTMSFGVAEFPHDGSTRDELVRAADAALYSAKRSGRDRVRVAAFDGAQRLTGTVGAALFACSHP